MTEKTSSYIHGTDPVEQGEGGMIELRAGDAMRPPLAEAEWGSFDLAHARFVLEHVPDPFSGARASVVAGGDLEAATFDRTIEAIHVWGERPDAALWFSRCWAEGVKPE